AVKAMQFARNQITLAQQLKDPVLECKCWIYYAVDLIELGKIQKAEKIIARQKNFAIRKLHGDQT
ncbi:17110_t:CDS:1, partial [Acaulospora morrowiae]